MSTQQSKKDKQAKIQEIIGKYRRAGEISIEAKKIASKLIKPGANAWEAAEEVEGYIREQGADPSFPINISINNEAAHYSPEILDDRVIPENAIVKVDLGAQIDGYIVDTALTLNYNDDLEELKEISKDALDAVIAVAKPGVKIADLGSLIERVITNAGFQPVRNLSGHQIKRYVLHAGVSIPNAGPGFMDKNQGKLKAGRIYAVEPFASNGVGLIENGKSVNIYRFINKPSKKQQELIPLYNTFKKKVGPLPFSPRHLYDPDNDWNKEAVTMGLRKLMRKNIIMGYPVLVEQDRNAMVSQHEHTLRITRDGCEVLTSNEHD